jgi:hypothetical protein
MYVKTKLTLIIAEDSDLEFKTFNVEDLEEVDALSLLGGDGRGNYTIPKSPDAGYDPTLDFSPLTTLKKLFILVQGTVKVFLNGDAVGFTVSSTGTYGSSDFVYGKLVFSGSAISSVEFENMSTSAAAKLMIGYAG